MGDRIMIQIGQLEIYLEYREVRSNGRTLQIGSRAYDILEVLIQAEGKIVSKNELISRVWPNTVVEENNLQVHISALRRLFGSDRDLIRTVPGRGYRLIVPPGDTEGPDAHCLARPEVTVLRDKLLHPAVGLRLIGRENALHEIAATLDESQIVTLVGAGGIGKTRLAVQVGEQLATRFPDGVVFVALAPVADTQSAYEALATAFGCTAPTYGLVLDLLSHALQEKRMLIVLDNCEHVIDAAAQIAEALANASRYVRVLASSREALRAREEAVYNVPPLDVPEKQASCADILQASSVQLFLARACAADPRFLSDDRTVYMMGLVCRRLDGIPLAIELAAARAAVLGVDVLANNLDDRFRILTGGSRTALPRHQTLKATLDWSYRLLDEIERKIFRSLGIFVTPFTFDAAFQVAGGELSRGQLMNAIGGLVSKSLLIGERIGARHRYRLLETTRAYALQQLDDNGERRAIASAHARYFCFLFGHQQDDWQTRAAGGRQDEFRGELDNLRMALDWSFSTHGDTAIGVELSTVVGPYLLDLSLVRECRDRAEAALQAIGRREITDVAAETKLRLVVARATSAIYTDGPGENAQDTWQEVVALATELGNEEFESVGQWGLWVVHQYAGKACVALAQARNFVRLAAASRDIARCLIGQRIEGVALHYAGQQNAARQRLEAMLEEYSHAIHGWDPVGFQIEHSIVARATLARILWLQASPAEAVSSAEKLFDSAMQYGHEAVACNVLIEAVIPIALLSRAYKVAERGLATLREMSLRCGFSIWLKCCSCYEEYLASMRGTQPERLAQYRAALDQIKQTHFLAPATLLLCQLASSLLECGRVAEASSTLEEALDHCKQTGERWFYAELIRVKGDILSAAGQACEAEQCYLDAARYARGQDATTLELRAAASLAKHLKSVGRLEEIHALLAPFEFRFPSIALRVVGLENGSTDVAPSNDALGTQGVV